MKILNFGSLNVDYIYEVDHLVEAGETLSSKKLIVEAGGKGLNQSLALSKSLDNIYHAGLIGQSERDLFVPLLEKNNISAKFIKTLELQSGHAIIQLDKNGQNNIILFGGTNLSIDDMFVDEVLSNFEKGDIILLQNEISCMPTILKKSIEKGMRIFLNPSPMNNEMLEYPIEKVDTLILNEVEGEQLTGCRLATEIIETLTRKYPEINILLTLGSEGSIYANSAIKYHEPALKSVVVDTTAAGDTFTGYFIGSIAKGCEISEALKIASAAASIAVSKLGAACSIPDSAEVACRLNQVIR